MINMRAHLTDAYQFGVLLLAIAAAAVFFNPAPPWSYFIAALLTLVALVVVGCHVWAWKKHVERCRRMGQEADAMHWVRGGSTEKEVQDRYAQAQAAGLLMSHSASRPLTEIAFPAVNTDGTPMLPGMFVDIKGNAFGVSSGTDIFSEVSADGGLMNLNDAYSSPLGIDNHGRAGE